MAKEFLWRGKSEEEVISMDKNEFLALITSRARRSLERGLTSAQESLMKKIAKNEKNIRTHCRDMVIVPEMLGKQIKVYNGKEFIAVDITLEKIGHFLGEFALSRKVVSHSAAGVGATRSSKAISAR